MIASRHYSKTIIISICVLFFLTAGCQRPSQKQKKVSLPSGPIQSIGVPRNGDVKIYEDRPGFSLDIDGFKIMTITYTVYDPDSPLDRGVKSGLIPVEPREQLTIQGNVFLLHISENGFTAICPAYSIMFLADGDSWDKKCILDMLESIEFRPAG